MNENGANEMNANVRAMTQVALSEVTNATIGDNDPAPPLKTWCSRPAPLAKD